MNKFVKLFVISCICLVVASCSREVTIGGTAERTRTLGLYTFNKGEIALLQEVSVDKETGTFSLVAELPYNGLYLFGKNENVLSPIYLKGGECLNLELRNNALSLAGGKASEENRLLFGWENAVNELKTGSYLHKYLPGGHALAHDELFEELQDGLAYRDSLLKELDGKKGEFYAFLADKANAELDFYAMNYLRTEAFNIPDSSALKNYYGTFEPGAVFRNPSVLDVPYSGRMLEAYVWYMNRDKKLEKGEVRYFTESLGDKSLQQEYLLSAIKGMKFYDEYRNMVDQIGEGFFDSEYVSKVAKAEERLLWSKPGVAAFDFKAVAPDSSWMNLSDYKGKVVVVDVWATWCEPCRRMMPLFHELQKEMANENVVFLSVCVGTWIEQELWLKMNKEFHLAENTFFVTGWESDFVKNYRISGVPRYMIFDEEGAIVTVNAPNPTTPKLKERILQVLE